MSYTPLNQSIFQAAFAASYAGMNGEGIGSGTAPSIAGLYSSTANVAFAFAQSYDTNRGSAAASTAEILDTESMCYSAWFQRNPTSVIGATTPATWTGLSADILAAINEGLAVVAGSTLPSITGNRAWITFQITTNSQGAGGPTILALVQLVTVGSGIFRWAAGGAAGAVAADISTWDVTSQTGTGAFTTTGGTQVTAAKGNGVAESQSLFASGAAGTGIVITAGGGTLQTLSTKAITVGTAYVGDKFSDSGLVYNAGAPFPVGSNVALSLQYTNSVANRAITSLNLYLEEI
jgi:hypothetical protein